MKFLSLSLSHFSGSTKDRERASFAEMKRTKISNGTRPQFRMARDRGKRKERRSLSERASGERDRKIGSIKGNHCFHLSSLSPCVFLLGSISFRVLFSPFSLARIQQNLENPDLVSFFFLFNSSSLHLEIGLVS